MIAALCADVEVGVVEPGAQVAEPGVGSGEQVPDDDQDRASDRDDRFLLASSVGNAAVAFTEERVDVEAGPVAAIIVQVLETLCAELRRSNRRRGGEPAVDHRTGTPHECRVVRHTDRQAAAILGAQLKRPERS